jgi:hypothetical protein
MPKKKAKPTAYDLYLVEEKIKVNLNRRQMLEDMLAYVYEEIYLGNDTSKFDNKDTTSVQNILDKYREQRQDLTRLWLDMIKEYENE